MQTAGPSALTRKRGADLVAGAIAALPNVLRSERRVPITARRSPRS